MHIRLEFRKPYLKGFCDDIFCQLMHKWGGFALVAVMPLAGWALVHLKSGSSVNPITTGGQIIPTILLLAHPDLKT